MGQPTGHQLPEDRPSDKRTSGMMSIVSPRKESPQEASPLPLQTLGQKGIGLTRRAQSVMSSLSPQRSCVREFGAITP
jgi:hypothetical protein